MEIPKNDFQVMSELFEQMRVNAWNSFLKQYEEMKLCDVMIKCGEKQFYSHRCILSAISPYFKVMFSSDYSQNIDNGYFVSDLSDFPPNCVHFLLDFVYQKPDIDTALLDLLEFLKLLDYLQIKDMHDIVDKVARQHMNINNCFKVLEVADICRISKLAKISLAFITSNIKDILIGVDFTEVSQNAIMLCLHSEIFQYVSTEDATAFVTAWVLAKHDERQSMKKLLQDELHHSWPAANIMPETVNKNLDLVLHYNSESHGIFNVAESRKIDSFSAFENITFLQQKYNHQEISFCKLLFSNNILYMAALLGNED